MCTLLRRYLLITHTEKLRAVRSVTVALSPCACRGRMATIFCMASNSWACHISLPPLCWSSCTHIHTHNYKHPPFSLLCLSGQPAIAPTVCKLSSVPRSPVLDHWRFWTLSFAVFLSISLSLSLSVIWYISKCWGNAVFVIHFKSFLKVMMQLFIYFFIIAILYI